MQAGEARSSESNLVSDWVRERIEDGMDRSRCMEKTDRERKGGSKRVIWKHARIILYTKRYLHLCIELWCLLELSLVTESAALFHNLKEHSKGPKGFWKWINLTRDKCEFSNPDRERNFYESIQTHFLAVLFLVSIYIILLISHTTGWRHPSPSWRDNEKWIERVLTKSSFRTRQTLTCLFITKCVWRRLLN